MERSAFYDAVRKDLLSYLPVGFQGYQVWIREVDTSEGKQADVCIYNHENSAMPFLNIEAYYKQIVNGADVQGVLIDMAVAYAKKMSLCRE